ncbi:MFS transporter [Natronosporangium hydrolyticum]|uniref:MFS transporter n=2 Tax=Natronosporangium hydrolyticum TaxID=2811111 RepID=A0A895YT67_9ACTN|nr:MFS transporter [Natronosporangium hydrolyticum]
MEGTAGPSQPPSSRRERAGWICYDWANQAFITTVVTVFLGPYLTAIADQAARCPVGEPDCTGRISIGFLEILPGQLFPYLISASAILTIVVLPLVGAIADRSPYKRELLAFFAYLGAGATMGMFFLVDDRWLLGAVLFLIANVAFGASIVVYNSYLPQLAGPDERDQLSSTGWAVAYIGGGILLAVNLAALLMRDQFGLSEADVVRYNIVSAGIWWAAFTTVPMVTLRNRPPLAGPPQRFLLTDGFVQLWHTLKGLRKYPLTLLFLVAYLIYSDGVSAVIALSATYGSAELRLSADHLVMTILVVQFVAFFGALAMGRIAARVGARKTVLGGLVGWSLIVSAAYFLPPGQLPPFLALGVAIGLVLGGTQALSRSLFSQLIPKGKEGEYFGIYEITDKATSWLAPLLFGLALGATESYRVAILSVIAFFVVGFVLLLLVPMRRAIIAAGNTPPRVL